MTYVYVDWVPACSPSTVFKPICFRNIASVVFLILSGHSDTDDQRCPSTDVVYLRCLGGYHTNHASGRLLWVGIVATQVILGKQLKRQRKSSWFVV